MSLRAVAHVDRHESDAPSGLIRVSRQIVSSVFAGFGLTRRDGRRTNEG